MRSSGVVGAVAAVQKVRLCTVYSMRAKYVCSLSVQYL